MTAALRLVPVVDARLGGPLAMARAAAVQMSDLLATARLIYSPPLLEAMDRVSYVGVITAIGRRDGFAAAINQPPLLSYGAILPVDWRGGEAGERCWIVDPIDGTNNFLRGLPLWGVSIAHAIAGERVRRF